MFRKPSLNEIEAYFCLIKNTELRKNTVTAGVQPHQDTTGATEVTDYFFSPCLLTLNQIKAFLALHKNEQLRAKLKPIIHTDTILTQLQ